MSQLTLLTDGDTIPLSPQLAVVLGVNHALVLQQLHFLLTVTQKAGRAYNRVGGYWWVYNSYEQWQTDHFKWLGRNTIVKIFTDLEAKGLVVSMQSVKHKMDRRKWYRINYDNLSLLAQSIVQSLDDATPPNDDDATPPMLDDDSSETTPETPTKTTTNTPASDDATRPTSPSLTDATKQKLTKTSSKQKAKKPKEPKPPKADAPPRSECPRDPLYEAVEEFVFEITPDPNTPYVYTSRVGGIALWLAGKITNYQKKSLGAAISRPATPDHVKRFVAWYKGLPNNKASLPRTPHVFVERWRQWASEINRRQQQTTPANATQVPTDALKTRFQNGGK